MSYNVSFYLVDLDELKKTIGSGNLSILDKIEFGDEEDEEEEFDEDDEEVNLRECVKTLLEGSPQNPDSGSQYGYALEKIVVDGLGCEWLNAYEFESLHFADFDGPLAWMMDSGAPVKLPPNDDFPTIGFRAIDEMKNALKENNIPPNLNEEEDDEEACDHCESQEEFTQFMVQRMYKIFCYAVKQKKDLITFYY